jgi:periplasmic divalent cation tolerance protein
VTGCCQVTTAVAEEAAAAEMADTVVAERLAACAQVLGPVRSSYHWEGEVRIAQEWLVVSKTTDARVAELTSRIRALHSYDVPEIVTVAIAEGNPEYLRWIRDETIPIPPETR